jgi:MoxR-like ATPase
MTSDSDDAKRRIARLDQASLEARLREAANRLHPQALAMDDLEVRHLVRVITECSLLLSDVYSEERIARIMHPERGFLGSLVDQLIRRQRRGEGEVLYRVRRLPDDVRVIGDKALFDLGLFGQTRVKGYDLEELGSRAYRMAAEVLSLLAEDRRLKEFFKENRLLVLPLEEEVVFLNQCAERFRIYADVLQRSQGANLPFPEEDLSGMRTRLPLLAAAAEALESDDLVGPPLAVVPADLTDDPYTRAARGEEVEEVTLTREQLISSYERILLFSALDMDRLRQALNATVVDQPQAVEALCDEFNLFAAGTRDPRKPPAYFLVGPTGVGKNHLVESLCRTLEGVWKVDIPTLTIEGPNYTYPSDINELRGATRGFIRSDEEGLLTSFHEKSSKAPVGVILVDEVEKAHSQLLTFFLSILDRGTTTDNRGNVLNFANCIVFFTSNLGYSDAQQRAAPIGFFEDEARVEAIDTDIRKELRRGLKPEFLNRVRMVHFDRLSRASAERILDLELERIARRYREVHGLRVELDRSARDELIRRGFSEIYGARHLAATLESVCNVNIAKRIQTDDCKPDGDREQLMTWLREMRAGDRAFQADDVKRKVMELAGARLEYESLRVAYRNGEFVYEPVVADEDPS